jgi:hypothetical protein
MYGIRPARYTIEELTAQAANAIRNVPSSIPNQIVWKDGRWQANPEYVQFIHGRFQEVL